MRRGLITFRDDKELKRGEVISQELLKAIEESLSTVVILSESYASSAWCLDELLKILECRKLLDRKVLPVFYGVDPSTVRYQKGSFETTFKVHEERFREEKGKVQRWRNALKEVAELSGQDCKNLLETEIIENIVTEVWKKVQHELPTFNNGFVGIDSRIEYMYSLLRINEMNDVRFIGIWGMGGMGKTTVAAVVFKKIYSQFDIGCFLANVREVSGQRGHGLIQLQRELLSRLNICGMRIETLEQGKDIIRNLLFNKKVLLILDDVSIISQLDALAGNREWFGLGSRIIVTTRDRHILTAHGIYVQYKIDFLNKDQSLQLFSQKAFKSDQPPGHFLELSNCVVQYAGGLPLALKVIGSFLCGRDISIWEDVLNMLKKDPQNAIWKILKISYDGLFEMEKGIFLHIACFLKGKLKSEVIEVLKNYGFNAKYGIDSRTEKSLVTLDSAGYLGMHDLLKEMGKHIVIRESPCDASKRSRLWSFEDIDQVFRNTTGNESILAMDLNFPWTFEAHWDPEVFSKMHNLKLLIVSSYDWHLPLDLNCLSHGLRVLIWRYCPLTALSLGVPLDELIHLEMQYSKIHRLWNGRQLFAKLVFVDLSYSDNIITTPNFNEIPNLQKLCLGSCKKLIEVDPSIEVHKKLIEANLEWCGNLRKLPRKLEMSSLTQLKVFMEKARMGC